MSQTKRVRSITLASLGMMFEWYDFALFALLSNYLVTIFFSAYSKTTADSLVMAVFIVAYIGRCVGGSVLASFADRYGRRTVFIFSSLLMTVTTFLIAIYPVHYVHALVAAVSLFALRFLQGLSIGSETPGGMVYAFEQAKDKYKGFALAFIYVFIYLGYFLAFFVCEQLSNHFTHQQIIDYAWRIPYFIATALGLTIFFLRQKLDETPDFTKIGVSKQRKPFRTVLKHYRLLLLSIGCYFLVSCLIDFLDMSNIYVTTYFHYAINTIYSLGMFNQVLGIISTLAIGVVLAKMNIKYVLWYSWFLIVCVICPAFWLLSTNTHSGYLAWAFSILVTQNIAWLGLIFFLNKRVDVTMRSSFVTLFDNASQLIGACFPFVVTLLIAHTHDKFIIPKFIWALSLIMLVSIILLTKHKKSIR